MGISASSLLDESKSAYVRDRAEAALKEFSPYYRKQFSVTRLAQVEEDLEPHQEKMTLLLKQREAPEDAEVLYEEGLLYFDENRKWRERYVVVRANYSLECHDSLETFVKGVPPRQKLLPTGGTILTTEEKYMEMVDQCFPDDGSVKEDFAPPLAGMPGQFPVYLRLPYRRDSYFCFRQQREQEAFLSSLSDCIRHQNQDFLKKKTCEVQSFLKAIHLYRQDRGRYEAWNMLIGSDVRVMGNLVMEQLLPSLEKDMLPRLKAKKTEKKRVWFATVEAAYILAQEHLLEGLSALKEDCRTSARQQEVLIHSDMDQILEARRQLEEKVRAKVSAPAEKLCSESVQPFLGSILEDLMEPISSGFQEGRQLSEGLMDDVCQDFLLQDDSEKLKKTLANMARPNLLSCYRKIGSLQDRQQNRQDRFGFSDITGAIHGAQIDLQQLIENAAFTFEQMFYKAVQDYPENSGVAVTKAKHRVLKQYDYDSSTVRKRICREALVSITLPFMKKNLNPSCQTELLGLDQFIDSDLSSFIHVQNVYESLLLETLDKEVTKVVKEASSLQKYNLLTDSRDLLGGSNRSSLSSPTVSTPSSPAFATKASTDVQLPSPPVENGLLSTSPQEERPEQENGELQEETSEGLTIMETTGQKGKEPKGEEVQTVTEESGATAASAESTNQIAPQEVEIQEEVVPVQSGELTVSETPEKEVLTVPASTEAPEPRTDEETPESPSAGQTPGDLSLDQKQEEPAATPNSVDGSAPSDVKTTAEEVNATPRSEDEGSTTSDILEDEENLSRSPVSSEDPAEGRTEPSPRHDKIEAGASEAPSAEDATICQSSKTTEEKTASGPEATPPDSIKEIRDLVVETIEVEELVQRYPSGIHKDD